MTLQISLVLLTLFIQLDLMPQINMIQIMYIFFLFFFFKNTSKEIHMKFDIKKKFNKKTQKKGKGT